MEKELVKETSQCSDWFNYRNRITWAIALGKQGIALKR